MKSTKLLSINYTVLLSDGTFPILFHMDTLFGYRSKHVTACAYSPYIAQDQKDSDGEF